MDDSYTGLLYKTKTIHVVLDLCNTMKLNTNLGSHKRLNEKARSAGLIVSGVVMVVRSRCCRRGLRR